MEPMENLCPDREKYPAYLACNLYCAHVEAYTAPPGEWMDCRFPKITQDGKDGDEENGYIFNMRDGATAGYKYFNCSNSRLTTVKMRGSGDGVLEVKNAWNGEVLGTILLTHTNEWKNFKADIALPDGVQALYFTYRGEGRTSLAAFTLS